MKRGIAIGLLFSLIATSATFAQATSHKRIKQIRDSASGVDIPPDLIIEAPEPKWHKSAKFGPPDPASCGGFHC
jgi:hypothetical protein